jgi:hypothetical protein
LLTGLVELCALLCCPRPFTRRVSSTDLALHWCRLNQPTHPATRILPSSCVGATRVRRHFASTSLSGSLPTQLDRLTNLIALCAQHENRAGICTAQNRVRSPSDPLAWLCHLLTCPCKPALALQPSRKHLPLRSCPRPQHVAVDASRLPSAAAAPAAQPATTEPAAIASAEPAAIASAEPAAVAAAESAATVAAAITAAKSAAAEAPAVAAAI